LRDGAERSHFIVEIATIAEPIGVHHFIHK